jgi:transketolase
MRKIFVEFLLSKMKEDPNTILLTGDLGYGLFDIIRERFPEQFFNFGSSELTMVTAACGMTLEGKKVYCYSITPFILWRPFEAIRNYLDKEMISVKLIGGGRDREYGYLGFSHWGDDDLKFMSQFEKIISRKPIDDAALINCLEDAHNSSLPYYINLKK